MVKGLFHSMWIENTIPTPCCCSSLDSTTKNGALGLLANLGQPNNVLAPMGSLLGESFDGTFASLLEN